MDKRRGLLMALVHFVIAGALIACDMDRERHSQTFLTSTPLILAAWQESESSITFDPCHGKGYVDYFISPQQRTVQIDNLPAWALTGWSIPCPFAWTLAGILQSQSNQHSLNRYMAVSLVLCALVPLQWFLIGAFPLATSHRWYLDPGAAITICTSIMSSLILLSRMLPIAETVDVISTLGMAIEFFLWLCWGSLLLWKGLHGGWRLLLRSRLV